MRSVAVIVRVVLVAIVWWSGATPAESTERPLNVVMILADDLGWTDLTGYGSDLHETPEIDRFARESMKFTHAYAAAPICSPTRAAWMTGKYPARLHMTIWHEYALRGPDRGRRLVPPRAEANLPHAELTLAEALKAAGYRTLHVGKWHLGDAGHFPETQGFEVNIGGTMWGAPATFFYPYRGPFGSRKEPRYVPDLHDGKEGEYLTDRLTDEALELIEASKDAPFFLNLSFHTVHTPIEGKPELVSYFQEKVRPDRNHHNPTYAAMVRSLDENVGRVLRRLDALGLRERTIVIFTSDNGGVVHRTGSGWVTTNAPLRSGKGSLYEGGIRVPLIVRWPGVTEAGSVSDVPVSTQDFVPTLVEGLGLSVEAERVEAMDGVSLLSVLRGGTATLDRRALFWHYPHYYPTTTPVSAMRSGDWKLLFFYEDRRVELYDLEDDPGEKNDLSKVRPEITRSLRGRLEEWLRDVGAQLPVQP